MNYGQVSHVYHGLKVFFIASYMISYEISDNVGLLETSRKNHGQSHSIEKRPAACNKS